MNTPIILQPLWGDERVWCTYARSNNIRAAAVCPNHKGYCALNGSAAQSPCAFDELPDSALWNDIRQSVAEYRQRGWL